jgi:hypothetical protein
MTDCKKFKKELGENNIQLTGQQFLVCNCLFI